MLSAPLWEALRLAAFAQFPWRLLSFTTVTMAVLAGACLLLDERLRERVSLPLLAAVLGIVVLGSYNYLQPQIVEPRGAGVAGRPDALRAVERRDDRHDRLGHTPAPA